MGRSASSPPVRIRAATDSDVSRLAALYADAVRSAGPSRYTQPQVQAWAAFADEREAFRRFITDASTFVAEDDTGPVGFTGLAPDGHVTALYVRADRMREGIGTALLRAVLQRARQLEIHRLYAEASALSRPLFERFGFEVEAVERVERRGVAIERYRVVRDSAD